MSTSQTPLPCRRGVTQIALLRPDRFMTRRQGMATTACAQYLRVVGHSRNEPVPRRVTGLAQRGRSDMVEGLTGGEYAVVASAATTRNAGVIEGRGSPGLGRVANAAVRRGWDVTRRLAPCGRVAVAIGAGTKNLSVVDGKHRLPKRKVNMAGLAHLGTGRVTGRFSSGVRPVVTVGAAREYALVTEEYRQPGSAVMAIRTIRGGRDMGRRFPRRLGAIVASRAGPGHLSVVDGNHRYPKVGDVTTGAKRTGGNVARRLSGRGSRVVTGETIGGDARMIEGRSQPGGGCMALCAIACRQYMGSGFAYRLNPVVAGAA